MDSLMIALVMHQRTDGYEARSALPNAPVRPDTETVAAHRVRRSLERGLRHLADAVAPPAPVTARGCTTC